MSNDTRIIQTALGFLGTDLIEQPVTAIIVIFALIHLDARFTFISLVLFPLCMVPVIVYGKRIRKSGRQEEEQSGAMISILQETFAGIRVMQVVRARGLSGRSNSTRHNVSQFHTAIRVRKYTEIVGPMVEIVAALGVGLALVYVHYAGMQLTTFHQPDRRLVFALCAHQADQPDARAGPEVPRRERSHLQAARTPADRARRRRRRGP